MSSRWMKFATPLTINVALMTLAGCVASSPSSPEKGGGHSVIETSEPSSPNEPADPSEPSTPAAPEAPDASDGGDSSYPFMSNECGVYVPEAGPVVVTGNYALVASDLNVTPQLALANGTLFWIDRNDSGDSSIQSLATTGGTATPFYAAPAGGAALEDLAVDATELYFSEVVVNVDGSFTSTLKSVPLTGGTPTVIFTETSLTSSIMEITVAGGYVYFDDTAVLSRVTVAGGSTAETLHSNVALSALTSDGTHVYWTETDDSGDTSFMTLTDSDGVSSLGNANGFAATTNTGNVFWSANADDSGDPAIYGAPAVGGSANVIATLPGSDEIVALAADTTNLYVTVGMIGTPGINALHELPQNGNSGKMLVSGFRGLEQGVTTHSIVTDDAFVYWPSSLGILRAPK